MSMPNKISLLTLISLILSGCGPAYTPKKKPQESPGLPSPTETKKNDDVPLPGPITVDEKTDEDPDCTKPKLPIFDRLIVENENPKPNLKNVADLFSNVEKMCGSCHLAPEADKGGFTFVAQLENRTLVMNGKKVEVKGIKNAYPNIVQAIENGTMPPQAKKQQTTVYKKMAEELRLWEASGFSPSQYESKPIDPSKRVSVNSLSELGTCIPSLNILGSDKNKDAFFANIDSLPKNLRDTDLFTLDSKELAKSGTVSYSVEYPLWADNAEKGRYVHFPELSSGKRAEASLMSSEGKFKIPANSRFYKNFYKAVKNAEGSIKYKIIETRIIVTRAGLGTSLFGTYKWNDDETNATLEDNPYRDGTGFRDDIFYLEIDAEKKLKRKYVVPGSERCVECHKVNDDLVLGFTPLQLNRRAFGEGGRDLPIAQEDLDQVERLKKLGFLQSNLMGLPKLESDFGTPSSEEELRLQGYLVGNCAHCHSPNGFATKDNQVKLELGPGKIFQFNVNSISKNSNRENPNYFIRPGDISKSGMYKRVVQEGVNPGEGTLAMPLHTPGDASCRLLHLMGSWIYKLGGKKPEDFAVNCQAKNDFFWIDRDLTWPKNDRYVPRRSDWKESSGMSEKFKSLRFGRELDRLAQTIVPAGFYQTKGKEDLCSFPERPLPRKTMRWMVDDQGKPRQPFGEAYFTTPGAWAYNSTCAKCHGNEATSKSALASNLLTISGGSIRVPSFRDELFGNEGENLQQFNVLKNDIFGPKKVSLAPNYLIWMAMEGTKVVFPPVFEPYLGKHKAQMLNQVRERCKGLIETSPQKLSDRMIDYGVFKEICFYRNGNSKTKEIQYDPETDQPVNEKMQDQWADRAAINVGYAIFKYLKDSLPNKLQETPASCEKRFPK